MRASREANEYCSSPFLEHSTQLSKRSIPKRFYHLFDTLGTNTQNYRPGIRWCNKCATIADNALSKEYDYIPPKKQTKSTTTTSTRTHSPNNNRTLLPINLRQPWKTRKVHVFRVQIKKHDLEIFETSPLTS
ncbi:uncharacterized protein [Montipora foliosa]|uniref:uncharacterized protein n=1 Tax=Montipora foliosa TaxID=591990 RepID=UPI0035F1678C